MITFSLNSDWDLHLDDEGNIAIKSDKEQIAQDVASCCRVWEGEDIWNTKRGIPYKSEVFGQKVNISLLQSYLNDEARRTPGVDSAQVIINSFVNRNIDFDIIVTTSDGETVNV